MAEFVKCNDPNCDYAIRRQRHAHPAPVVIPEHGFTPEDVRALKDAAERITVNGKEYERVVVAGGLDTGTVCGSPTMAQIFLASIDAARRPPSYAEVLDAAAAETFSETIRVSAGAKFTVQTHQFIDYSAVICEHGVRDPRACEVCTPREFHHAINEPGAMK